MKPTGYRKAMNTDSHTGKRAMSVQECRDYKVAGLSPKQAKIINRAGVSADEYVKYKAAGLNVEEVVKFKTAGFTPKEAGRFRNAQLSPEESRKFQQAKIRRASLVENKFKLPVQSCKRQWKVMFDKFRNQKYLRAGLNPEET